MRFLITVVLLLICASSVSADQIPFSKVVKASLVFRGDADVTRLYPHVLKVFLCLDNTYDSDLTWVADAVYGVEAELLDPTGKPVTPAPGFVDIFSGGKLYMLPYGSRFEWLISHDGISVIGDTRDKYVLEVGGQAWLIPLGTAVAYSLRVRLRGTPWTRTVEHTKTVEPKLLLELPPTKLAVTP